jgi:predicted metalloprotease with PDZ domain
MNFRTQSLQRLHEQLRHELFHLWLPNAVNLTGKYDWFYEGFALYQSLKTAVAMNRIRFDDFLDTLSRAYSIDSRQTRRMSLIDASKSRFEGNDTQIYARGMLVAFLADLSILEQSKGRSSVSTFLGELFSKHRSPNAAVDGTEAVIASMRKSNINEAIIVKYVLGSGPFEWNNEISAAGIEPPDAGAKTGLTVRPKPTGRQKALLDKLGYNNWRKLSSSKK